MFLRVFAVLACAAYAAAVHCAQCPAQVDGNNLSPDGTCYHEIDNTVVTSCMYGSQVETGFCFYDAAGVLTDFESGHMCPEKVAIQGADNCSMCHF